MAKRTKPNRVTAGYEGESTLLEGLVKRGLAGEQIAPDFYKQPGISRSR
jgi:hypothetical protein